MTTATIRTAVSEDRDAILALVREAFSSPDGDGREEIDIVVSTWTLGAAPPALELVAVDEGAIVGHVLCGRGDLTTRPVVGVAPLAVIPAGQGRGVGSALMTELLRRADAAGLPMLVLLGSPAYYTRFGFEPSAPLGITYRFEDNPHFQVRRLAAYEPGVPRQLHLLLRGPGRPPLTRRSTPRPGHGRGRLKRWAGRRGR